jgi:hypothetical protein
MKECKICHQDYDEEEGKIPIYRIKTVQAENGARLVKEKVISGYRKPFKDYCLSCSVAKNTRWRRFDQFMGCCYCMMVLLSVSILMIIISVL